MEICRRWISRVAQRGHARGLHVLDKRDDNGGNEVVKQTRITHPEKKAIAAKVAYSAELAFAPVLSLS